jgi:hypothetical protein
MPRASILIVFSESEFLSLMKLNHKLAIESAQAALQQMVGQTGRLPGFPKDRIEGVKANRQFALPSRCAYHSFKTSRRDMKAPFVFPLRLDVDSRLIEALYPHLSRPPRAGLSLNNNIVEQH